MQTLYKFALEPIAEITADPNSYGFRAKRCVQDKSGVHYVITLYKADKFTGELKSSEEGRVYWIPLEELKTKELATGMEHVLRILESEKVDECYMHLEADGYVGDLY